MHKKYNVIPLDSQTNMQLVREKMYSSNPILPLDKILLPLYIYFSFYYKGFDAFFVFDYGTYFGVFESIFDVFCLK
jgi:hypothetical protein